MDQQGVPPARVRGNNWRDLAVTPAGGFEPQLPVSVVVSYYEAPEALELTLAALERQTYPRNLFEVVIVDDGSRRPLTPPDSSLLDIRVLHQEDQGFGLARSRNTGARAAAHEILVFLDCDMMPEEGWLAEHARWHHAANDALTLGFRAHVDVDGIDAGAVRTRPGSLAELFADRPSDRPAWIEFHMTRTRQLTSDDDDLFRVVTGGNLGISRSFFESVGGYDETFTQWGAEDTEFGYRAYTMGGLLVPARDAFCWHQGAGAAPSEDESVSLKLQHAKISQLIAHHSFRETAPGRSFTVPQYVVTVEAGEAGYQMSTAEQVLANGIHDLVVWIAEPDGHDAIAEPDRERIRRLLGGDPRVRFGPSGGAPSGIPAASFHISLPAGATVKSNAVARLRWELRGSARANIKLPDRKTAAIVRTRALNREARSGISVDDPTVSPRPRRRFPRFSAVHKLGRVMAHIVREAARIRSLRDARDLTAWFLSWLARAAGWRIRRVTRWLYWTARRWSHALKRLARRLYWQVRRLFGQVRRLPWLARRLLQTVHQLLRRPSGLAWKTAHSDNAVPEARYRLGPDIAALGPRAEAVLAASSRVSSAVGEFTEAAIVDTPEATEGIAAGSGVEDRGAVAVGSPCLCSRLRR